MELSGIIPHIEALIFASDRPVAEEELEELLNKALGFLEDRISKDQIAEALQKIQQKYRPEIYPFEIVKSGGGWQFLTKPVYHATINQLYGDKFLKKLSVASMETLSIIAYEQPVTKSEIELIRGVNCDYSIRKLLEKELIVIAGRKEDAPGKPLIYTTSRSFMDYFGINSPEELPKIQEILDEEIVEATRVAAASADPAAPDGEVRESPSEEQSRSLSGSDSVKDEPDSGNAGEISEKGV